MSAQPGPNPQPQPEEAASGDQRTVSARLTVGFDYEGTAPAHPPAANEMVDLSIVAQTQEPPTVAATAQEEPRLSTPADRLHAFIAAALRTEARALGKTYPRIGGTLNPRLAYPFLHAVADRMELEAKDRLRPEDGLYAQLLRNDAREIRQAANGMSEPSMRKAIKDLRQHHSLASARIAEGLASTPQSAKPPAGESPELSQV